VDADELFSRTFSRESVLGGAPPTRRANIILFEIESRTAHLVAHSRQAMERFLTEKTAQERDMAFIEAFALGRNLPIKPTIQDLERHALEWADLVPQRVEMRAALAHQLGAKYEFTAGTVPGLRMALGLDSQLVQRAYRGFYDTPLDSIYVAEISTLDHLRWAWARLGNWLERLPPFWSVFALTLTETVGASILALPIALASIGPLPGIILLLVFGLANVLTVAYMAETASRSSDIRYRNSFIGQMVAEYLGRAGSVLLSLGVLVLCLFAILAFYIGFATTLTDATGVPSPLWVILLFGIGLYFVTRGSLNATVTLALVVGAVNLVMIAALILLTVPHITLENLTFVNLPFTGGQAFDASVLELVFGIIFAAFFGHLSVPNSAHVVLRRDPSGGALVRGAMAAQAVAIVINSVWVLAVNGAISPEILAGESGTSLIPLAAVIGPGVHIFGTVFVVLGLGIVSIHLSLALFNLTHEWLPIPKGPAISLPRRQGRLRLHQPGRPLALPQVSLVYLGLEGHQARFRLDIETGFGTQRVEIEIMDEWDAAPVFARYPELAAHNHLLQFKIKLLEVDPKLVRLRINTPLALVYEAGWDRFGLTMTNILALPEDQRDLINWMMRSGRVNLEQVATYLGQTPNETRLYLVALIEQGLVQTLNANTNPHYEVRMAATRSRHLSPQLAELAADGPFATPASAAAVQKMSRQQAFLNRVLDLLLGERGRFWLGLGPLILIFLAAQGLLLTGRESFSQPLSFIGVIVVAMLAGIFPVLLVQASRRRGDIVPEVVYRVIGHPFFLITIFLLSLMGVILHGLIIWDDPLMRILALVVAAVIMGMTFNAWRRKAFVPRFIVELRDNAPTHNPAQLMLTYSGAPLATDLRLVSTKGDQQQIRAARLEIPELATLQSITVHLPLARAAEIKVLGHQISLEGNSLALPVRAKLDSGALAQQANLMEIGGQVVLQLDGQASQLTLTLLEKLA
jgi:amino acid permease